MGGYKLVFHRVCLSLNEVFESRFLTDGASLVSQTVKHLPAMWETWVQSLGWEDPLEKGKAIHSSILSCRIPRTL